jgi:hypothetical protein
VRYGSGFCLDAGFPFRRLIYVTELSKAELDAMLEEAIIDCNDEEEQLAIHLLDLPLPEPPPKGTEWIAVYRRWAR